MGLFGTGKSMEEKLAELRAQKATEAKKTALYKEYQKEKAEVAKLRQERTPAFASGLFDMASPAGGKKGKKKSGAVYDFFHNAGQQSLTSGGAAFDMGGGFGLGGYGSGYGKKRRRR